MFTRSAALYDVIQGQRFDAATAARTVDALIQTHTHGAGTTVLDVACGTGTYLSHLRARYAVEGLDLDPGMLAVARQKLPGVPFHQADLVDFRLGRRFDAVLCLGSSIGYVETEERLRQALGTLARHALPGGVVIVAHLAMNPETGVGNIGGRGGSHPPAASCSSRKRGSCWPSTSRFRRARYGAKRCAGCHATSANVGKNGCGEACPVA